MIGGTVPGHRHKLETHTGLSLAAEPISSHGTGLLSLSQFASVTVPVKARGPIMASESSDDRQEMT